jgi:tetratricopeptide (TPR) repeat protein
MNADFYIERGWDCHCKKDYDQAIEDFNEAILLDPASAHAYIGRGCAWSSKKENARAIEDYSAAIRLKPTNANTYFLRGNAWYDLSDRDKAIADYNEAIRLDPNNAACYFMRGNASFFNNELDKAMKDCEEAIRINPESAPALGLIAWLLATHPEERFSDGHRAIRLATKACELKNWHDGWSLQALAAAYAETGQFDNAVRYQLRALEVYGSAGEDAPRRRLELYKQRKPARQRVRQEPPVSWPGGSGA